MAKIGWKVECASTGLRVESISVRTSSQTYESGSINWKLYSADTQVDVNPGNFNYDSVIAKKTNA